MDKFDSHIFWKHENCVDVFLRIYSSSFSLTGDTILVQGSWKVQGLDNHWYCSYTELITITAQQYDKWIPYAPKGENRDA